MISFVVTEAVQSFMNQHVRETYLDLAIHQTTWHSKLCDEYTNTIVRTYDKICIELFRMIIFSYECDFRKIMIHREKAYKVKCHSFHNGFY